MWMPSLLSAALALSTSQAPAAEPAATPPSVSTTEASTPARAATPPEQAAPASPAASASPAAPAAPSAGVASAPAAAAAATSPAASADATNPAPAADTTNPAAADKTLAAVEKLTVAILALQGNKAAHDEAPGVASILASTLAESPKLRVITDADIAAVIGVERQKALLSDGQCATDSCMTELAGALGSRYLVAGRLDRFGDKYVLTTTLFDSRSAISLAKPRREVEEQEALPDAATAMGKQLREVLGDGAGGAKASIASNFSVALKIGSGFVASVTALAPAGDVELGYRFNEEWQGLLQVGFKTLRTEADATPSGLNLLPSFVGLRKLHNVERAFQPYWGLGLGIQLELGRFGIFAETGPLPSLFALGGFQYMFNRHFGLLLEGKTNLAQATLGLVGGSSTTTHGFNIDLSFGVHYRF